MIMYSLLNTMFDHLLWLTISIFYQSCQSSPRIINLFLSHLIKYCNKIVVVNRITSENVNVNRAAFCLNNLLIIATISGWFLSGICPYSTASLPIAFDLPSASDFDFLSSGTTLTSSVLSSTFALRVSCL